MKLFVLIITLIFIGNVSFSQADIEYVVTNVTTLEDAITNVNINGDVDNDIVIYLNLLDDDGDGKELIAIPSDLASISKSEGSLVITSHPTTDVIQGFKPGFSVVSGGFSGVKIIESKNVTIKNVHFENFISDDFGSPNNAIYAEDSRDIQIVENRFDNNSIGVLFNGTNGAILTNEFENHKNNAIEYKDNDDSWNAISVLQISKNVITNDGTGTNDAGIRCDLKNTNSAFLISVLGNSVSNFGYGVVIDNNAILGIVQQAQIIVRDNIVSKTGGEHNGHGLSLIGVKSHWVVEDNTIDNQVYGIVLGTGCAGSDADACSPPDDFTIDFIEENSHGEIPNNTGNKIIDCKHSFHSRLKKHSNIIGYDVDGSISGINNAFTTILENTIHIPDDGFTNRPIYYFDEGPLNGNLSLVTATYDEGTVNVVVNTTGLDAINGPFRFDFYEADANGGLRSYIGYETISDPTPPETIVFSDVLLSSDRIGVTITGTGSVDGGIVLGTSEVEYIRFEALPCVSCNSFQPKPGRYWMSAWVSVDVDADDNGELDQVKSFVQEDGVSIELAFFGSYAENAVFIPTGDIIDGWQRVVGEFSISEGVTNLLVGLNADENFATYFDDIRIHPFNGSMKSYVYDGETFWLTSELDDNNFATFYEYDEEGGLIRIKKETSRGIVTIQETRSNTVKQ